MITKTLMCQHFWLPDVHGGDYETCLHCDALKMSEEEERLTLEKRREEAEQDIPAEY